MFDKLFEPTQVGGLPLKNRIVMPPMTTNFAHRDGKVSPRMVDYYRTRAEGGVGLIIVEAACVDYPRGKGLINELDISSNAAIDDFKKLTQAVKKAGAHIAVQLHHAGGLRVLAESIPVPPLAPSALGYRGFDTPNELNKEQIGEVQERFTEAALRAKVSGFDAVEFHGAHGYLICQFLSPITNRRKDEYGGSLENRTRFLREIIYETREKVGTNYPILCRLSADEYVEGGLIIDETKEIARNLEKAGVDAIHLSVSGTPSKSKREIMTNVPPMGFPEGSWVHLAEEIKTSCTIPVIVAGRILSPQFAETTLNEGKVDLVAIGRGLIADPQWPNKVQAGDLEDIRPCIGCNTCIGRVAQRKEDAVCAVNPSMGREGSIDLEKPQEKRRVLILGGGPAGMETALAAADRSHEVHLWEKDWELGGQFKPASKPPGKETLVSLCNHLRSQIKKSRINLQMSVQYQENEIKALAPDVIVVATGSRAGKPAIPGLEDGNVVTARDVLTGEASIGPSVLIIGGGSVGCETADFLIKDGRKITIVEQMSQLAKEMDPFRRRLMFSRLQAAQVDIQANTRLLRVTNSGGVVASLDGEGSEISADSIVLATEPTSNRDVLGQIKGLKAETYIIGDALRPRGFYDAFLEGRFVGYRI